MRMITLLLVPGCILEVGGGDQDWSFRDVTAVEAALSNGDVVARSIPGDEVFVDWEGGGVGENARPDVDQRADGTVVVDADGGVLGGGTLRLDVPEGADLAITVERGSIDVALDAPANVNLCAAAGDIDLGLPPGPYEFDVAVGIGDLDRELVHEPGAPYRIEVCLGAGDVDIYAM